MRNQGWVKAYRQLLDWEWYTDVPTFKLFLHLLLIVNREPQQWRGQTLGVGSVVTSVSALAAGSGLTDMQVRTALKHLQKTGEIMKNVTNKNTVITLRNYAKYQASVDDEQQTDNKQITNKQQTDNKQITSAFYKQECKNERIEKGRERASACTPAKLYGEFKNVRLTDEEYAKLKKQFPLDWQRLIKNLSFHIHNTHKTYYDHFSVLQKWGAEDRKNSGALQSPPSYDLEQIKRDTMNNTDIKF
nr:MAG TPA: replisome organizer [Caudoviricetes sp.]